MQCVALLLCKLQVLEEVLLDARGAVAGLPQPARAAAGGLAYFRRKIPQQHQEVHRCRRRTHVVLKKSLRI